MAGAHGPPLLLSQPHPSCNQHKCLKRPSVSLLHFSISHPMTVDYFSTFALRIILDSSVTPEQSKRVLERLEYPLDTLDKPHHFLPLRSGARTLWGEIQRITGDPLIGLHSAQRFSLSTLGPFLELLQGGKNLRSLFPLLARYMRVFDTCHYFDLEVSNDTAYLTWQLQRRTVHDTDWLGIVTLRVARLLLPEFALQSVQLAYPAPTAEIVAQYERAYGCPVHFEREKDQGCYFDSAWLEKEFSTSNAIAQELARQSLEPLLPTGNLSNKEPLASVYDQAVRVGAVDLSQVAATIGVTAPELQRQLRGLRTTHQLQVDRARIRLAEAMLRESDRPIAEVAQSLGFVHGASFAKAFRRLTGSSPRSYRQVYRGRRPAL